MLNRPLIWRAFSESKTIALILALLAGAMFSPHSHATTVIAPDFDQLVNESDYIVRAVVKSVTPERRPSRRGGRPMIYSRVELEVREVIAGRPPVPLVLSVLGGTMDGRELAIEGAPRFHVGDDGVFFVQGNGRQIFPLVRMMHGLYRVERDSSTGREYISRSDGEPLQAVGEVSQPVHAREPRTVQRTSEKARTALSPEEFVRKIRDAVRNPNLRER